MIFHIKRLINNKTKIISSRIKMFLKKKILTIQPFPCLEMCYRRKLTFKNKLLKVKETL